MVKARRLDLHATRFTRIVLICEASTSCRWSETVADRTFVPVRCASPVRRIFSRAAAPASLVGDRAGVTTTLLLSSRFPIGCGARASPALMRVWHARCDQTKISSFEIERDKSGIWIRRLRTDLGREVSRGALRISYYIQWRMCLGNSKVHAHLARDSRAGRPCHSLGAGLARVRSSTVAANTTVPIRPDDPGDDERSLWRICHSNHPSRPPA